MALFLHLGGEKLYINKDKVLENIINYAEKYKRNLQNKNIMFIFLNQNKLEYMETKFTKSNFLHLTGIKLKNKSLNANSFFDRCIKNRITKNDFELRNDGTTRSKIICIK